MPNRRYEGETIFLMIGLHISKKLKINMEELKANTWIMVDEEQIPVFKVP